MRGTPILLQLFVIYYGLASVVRLPAFVAALLGLGLNYAAYESEIYRGALEAVPRGQLEAARVLGFTEWQTLRLIRAPQAFRLALAPMTNDFVAMLKDSSLVSVLTVMELTKQTQIFATNIGSWVVPGRAVRGAVSRDVAAARAPRAAARGALEGADGGMSTRARHPCRCACAAARATSCAACRSPSRAGRSSRSWGCPGRARRRCCAAIAGLEPFDGGEIRVGDVVLAPGVRRPAGADPLRRQVGMVFQFHHLFEHLSAIDNVCLAPCTSSARRSRDARARASALLDQLGVGHRAAARAARAVRRRGAARRDRARARHGSAAAAARRADRVARSGAAPRRSASRSRNWPHPGARCS